MTYVLRLISKRFWNEEFWFPPGVNWTTLESNGEEKYTDFGDLWYPLFYAVVIIFVRFAFEWTIARPFGRMLGIVDTGSELPKFFKWLTTNAKATTACPSPVSSSDVIASRTLNGLIQRHPKGGGDVPLEFSSSCEATKKEHQRSASPPRAKLKSGGRIQIVAKSTLDKFAESCWRAFFYTTIFVYGLAVLWNKSWFRDTTYCWHGWPFQTVDRGIWWYYMIEAGFYWSLAISQFVDVQRKDFWVNFIHHIATILLIYFSWACNFVRVGTLTLVIHDAVDPWMEVAKMFRYCHYYNVCNFFFAVFTLIWFITRVGFYPFKKHAFPPMMGITDPDRSPSITGALVVTVVCRILYTSMIETVSLVGFCGAYYIFVSLLLLLQILHLFWSAMILKIVIGSIINGQVDDVRSDDEDD